LDTWTTGWRPQDLNRAISLSYVLENDFTDDVFLKRLAEPPREGLKAAALVSKQMNGKFAELSVEELENGCSRAEPRKCRHSDKFRADVRLRLNAQETL
jgi:hypothetical protein